ncbi:MAG TPA: elongation factor Ts [Planctomycetes bacterium]|jgi:elongation factor Ts|nr:elongation factor Ts [Planctomycetota bacterium]
MTITAKDVASLRGKTGAGMMDCKRALTEADGNEEKAVELLRQKGIEAADKKAGRETSEGRIHSYIHHNFKVGAMIKLSCETDFVSRGEDFAKLCNDICMHIATADPIPVGVSIDDIPADLIESERNVLLGSEDMANKPDDIKEKIIDGRIKKFVSERALLEQEFFLDPDMTVGQVVKAASGKLGENMNLEDFVRFDLS